MHCPFRCCFTMLPQIYKEGKKSIFINVPNPSSRLCQEIHAFTFTRCVKFLFTELVFQSLKEQNHTSFPFIPLKITVFYSPCYRKNSEHRSMTIQVSQNSILLMSSANTTANTCWFLLTLINDKMKVYSFLAPLRTQKTKLQVSAEFDPKPTNTNTRFSTESTDLWIRFLTLQNCIINTKLQKILNIGLKIFESELIVYTHILSLQTQITAIASTVT